MIKKGIKYLCSEYWLIENYDKAINDDIMWDCHHRLEIDENGKTQYSSKELIENGIYYHRPPEELVFLTKNEHRLLHTKGENHYLYGKHLSDEVKKKMSEAKKGKHCTEETKKKIAEAHIGKHHSEEAKQKIKNSKICSKVICLNNMQAYDSLSDAAKELNICKGNIGKVCKGERPHTCGLKFMYYDEYEKLNNNNTDNNCASITLF